VPVLTLGNQSVLVNIKAKPLKRRNRKNSIVMMILVTQALTQRWQRRKETSRDRRRLKNLTIVVASRHF
jgi:hypothetical protein